MKYEVEVVNLEGVWVGGVVVFFQKATTPLTKKHVFFAFRKCGMCFKRWYLKKKATTPPTQTHP
jgi:hypothetical protein